jgi:hypothetical protein
MIKRPHSTRLEPGPELQCAAWRPATRGQPKRRLGLDLTARSSRRVARVATPLRARQRVVTTRSPHVGRHGGAVTEGPVVARRWQGVASEL